MIERVRVFVTAGRGARSGLMRYRRDHRIISVIVAAISLAWAGSISARAGGAQAQPPGGEGLTATNPIKYRVNYRPTANDPWQQYAETRSLDKANAIAAEVQGSGYQSQVVNDLTPFPHVFPDMAETSASALLPHLELGIRLQLLRGARPGLQLRVVRRL